MIKKRLVQRTCLQPRLTSLESLNMPREAFHKKREEILNMCVKSDDEAFHYLFYQVSGDG